MSSYVLHDQIPHSALYPNQLLYFLLPRVFGCIYFVHILSPRWDKLYTKAMKCVFLGYSRIQRGYRCYSLDAHRYFISVNVTFFQDDSSSTRCPHVSDVLSLPITPPSPNVPSPSVNVPSRLLQFYTCRPYVDTKTLVDSSLVQSSSPAPIMPPTDDLPIVLPKGTHSTRNPHPIYNFMSYHHFSLPYSTFVPILSPISIPKTNS